MLNGTVSSWQGVLSGVPQGSVLGPLLFILYVNWIENGIQSRVLKFADDLKVFRAMKNETDHETLQRDLDKLVEWSEKWQMKFNVQKCKVMRVGRQNFDHMYEMGGQTLEIIGQEKDLGVSVNSKLGASEQCRGARKRGLGMLASINRNVCYKSPEVVKKLYIAYVRPHLEYCVQAWAPTFEKDCWLLERVQKRATKLVNGLYNLSYEARLKKLDMFSLRHRRLRGDLIEVFKFVKGQDQGYLNGMFEFSTNDYTRGHNLKLKVRYSRTRLRQSFFAVRVVKHWNELPGDIVNSSSLNRFKTSLDEHHKSNGIAYQY